MNKPKISTPTILGTITALLVALSTIWAMGDRFIAKATFLQFKEHITYRLDTIDKKLDKLLSHETR